MHRLTLVACLFVLAGCSGSDGDGGDDSTPNAGPSTESTSTPSGLASEPPAAADTCSLLTSNEATEIVGGPVDDPEPGEMAGVPQCIWPASAGTRWVQVASTDASTWSRALPQVVEQLKAGGAVTDQANLKKLLKGAELVESGQELDPAEACAMFSQMLEIQGEPPGSQSIVTAFPDANNAQSVSAQTCSQGWYTTVTATDPEGLDKPLPLKAVERTSRRIHREATS